MDTVYKTFKGEVSKLDDGSLNIYIPVSSKEWDRSEEVVEPTAFKRTLPKFKKHPVLVASHDYGDLENQIGEWTSLKITDNGLEGKPKYYVNEGNQTADWAYNLATKNRAAFSVGFIPKEWEDGDGKKSPLRTYKDVELLEISQCIIPANRAAIMGLRAKSLDNPIITELCDEVEKDLVTKPEETNDYIRIPISEGHDEHKIRTMTVSNSEGIKGLYCVDCKEIITYLFSKEKGWDMTKARAWIKEHKSINIEHEISQNEILDELDYLSLMLEENGLNDKAKETLQGIANKYLPQLIVEEVIEEAIQPATMAVKENNTEPTEQEILENLSDTIKKFLEDK